jgi:hypothetical protein
MQCLAQDTAEVAELQEEVTWARVVAIMAGAQAKRMAQRKVVLLAFAHGEVDKVARKISLLECKLVITHQA